MDNIFLVAGIISAIFFIAKFLEMRYVDVEPKPLKIIIRDSLLVYVSVVIGYFVVEQLNPVIKENITNPISGGGPPMVFTDNPPF
jgi:hypothetical protein